MVLMFILAAAVHNTFQKKETAMLGKNLWAPLSLSLSLPGS